MPELVNKNKNNQSVWLGINTGKFFLGLLILIVGFCYLGESFGLVTINVGYIFQYFWSILLIFLGLSMLSRRSRSMTIFGLVITAVVLVGLFYVATNNSAFPELKRLEKIEVLTLAGATKAHIIIDSPATALKIEGDQNPNDLASFPITNKLLTGIFQSAEMKLATSSELVNQTQNISLKTYNKNHQFNWQYFGNFYLKLSGSLPVDLKINSTAADINLDLANVLATGVEITSSASNIMINLGDLEPKIDLNIKSNASAVTLRIPVEMGVDLKFSSNISSKTLPDFVMVSDGRYESRNFNQAKKQAIVTLDSSVASFDVVWK